MAFARLAPTTVWMAIFGLSACSLNTKGTGAAAGTGETQTDTTSTTGGNTQDQDDGGTGGETGQTNGTTGDTTGDGTTSSDPCDATQSVLIWAEEADRIGPMQLLQAADLPDRPQFAFSESSGEGAIRFSFEVDCAGTYYAWGLVWDRYPGLTDPDNADSFDVSMDGGTSTRWEYGCGTRFFQSGTWFWYGVRPYESDCIDTQVSFPLEVGSHQLTLLNREDGSYEDGEKDVAGVAAVLISDNPNHDPYDDYDPQG